MGLFDSFMKGDEAKAAFRADAMREEGLDPSNKEQRDDFLSDQTKEWESRGVDDARDATWAEPETYADDAKDEK